MGARGSPAFDAVMTLAPLDRLKRTLARQPVARLPVGPYLANWNAQFTRTPFSTYCSDGRAMADALLAELQATLDAALRLGRQYVIVGGLVDFGPKTKMGERRQKVGFGASENH